MPKPTLQPGSVPRRRHALGTLARAAALGVVPGWCRAVQAAPDASAALRDDRAIEIAPGVHVLAGANAAPDAHNAGRVGNLGFVVGTTGVALIDTGSSRARAGELLAAVRRVTELPLKCVVITHPAQEFLFGAGLFLDQGVPVRAHPQTPVLMRQRCQHCLDTLEQDLGRERMAGTRLALPEALALPPPAIDLGGRRLLVTAGPAGTVPGNLTVLDESSGVLFTGALLSIARIPGVQDTRPADWQAALQVLEQATVRLAVPAYGPVAARQPAPGQVDLDAARQALAGYFGALEAQARRLYAQAVPLDALERQALLPDYRNWNGYPATHVHNIFYRYLQLEAEDLASQ
ncbi:MAG: MBL fold metallo-hydrolase [Pseudomonadota bacterium]|nr:MBL fold metallo-hydrolase [Pseudomonadota bacterium]